MQAIELYPGAKLSHLIGKGKINWTLKIEISQVPISTSEI
jgi:hypothetical protein